MHSVGSHIDSARELSSRGPWEPVCDLNVGIGSWGGDSGEPKMWCDSERL